MGADQDELAWPAHCMVLETSSGNQGSELSSSMMIPQMTVVADLACTKEALFGRGRLGVSPPSHTRCENRDTCPEAEEHRQKMCTGCVTSRQAKDLTRWRDMMRTPRLGAFRKKQGTQEEGKTHTGMHTNNPFAQIGAREIARTCPTGALRAVPGRMYRPDAIPRILCRCSTSTGGDIGVGPKGFRQKQSNVSLERLQLPQFMDQPYKE